MKKSKMQSRRPMPKARHELKVTTGARVLTVGDLISAAFDALGDAGQVVRVLGSPGLSERVGRKLAFI
jgi:hypothetical protein